MSIRVRFAPSPTGFLHIGGARTALFNWLYARHHGGTFVLRIEDTDDARNTQEAVDVILNGLKWLGLDWDEGPLSGSPSGESKGDRGPYFQSAREELYKKRVEELKKAGRAYERDGTVRFKMDRDPILIPDLVVGEVKRELTDREELDPDFVIVRSDGKPVFHLVNVVDDLEMGITHVIRGEDHLSNTSKHIALFRAFGVEPPQYAHIPLILNVDGSKMSKRDKGASLSSYAEEGYIAEAVINYLSLLGWSPKENREIMSIKDTVELFDLPQILRHNARFDQDKLNWLNYEHIKVLDPDRFDALAIETLNKAGIETTNYEPAYIRSALATCHEKLKTLCDATTFADFYFLDEVSIDEEAAKKDFIADNKPRLEALRAAFAESPTLDAANVETILKSVATELGVKPKILVHPLRLACTGRKVGPSLYHLVEVLGKDRVLKRLDRALTMFP